MIHKIVNWRQTPLIDFSDFHVKNSENYCLLHISNASPRQLTAPIFPVNTIVLRETWETVVKNTPRMRLLQSEQNHFQYVVTSKWLGFPDIIDSEIVSCGNGGSQLFIYSRSVYGYYDFKVNIRRIEIWLAQIKQLVARYVKNIPVAL